jgi:hypothetical protein
MSIQQSESYHYPTRAERKAARKAKQVALDAALHAYAAARQDAVANGTKRPNMKDFMPREAK